MCMNIRVRERKRDSEWFFFFFSRKVFEVAENSRSFLLTSLGYNVNQECVCEWESVSWLVRGVRIPAVFAVLSRFHIWFACFFQNAKFCNAQRGFEVRNAKVWNVLTQGFCEFSCFFNHLCDWDFLPLCFECCSVFRERAVEKAT